MYGISWHAPGGKDWSLILSETWWIPEWLILWSAQDASIGIVGSVVWGVYTSLQNSWCQWGRPLHPHLYGRRSMLIAFLLRWLFSLLYRAARQAAWYFSCWATTSPALRMAKIRPSFRFRAHSFSRLFNCIAIACLSSDGEDSCSQRKQMERRVLQKSPLQLWSLLYLLEGFLLHCYLHRGRQDETLLAFHWWTEIKVCSFQSLNTHPGSMA